MSTPATTPERLEAGREAAPSLLSRALALSTVGPLIALLLAIAFFTARTDRFLTGTNLSLVVQQVMVVGTLAIGQTDITYGSVLMLAMFALAWFVLRQTSAGRHVYAVGNNPEAARLTGIRTRRLLLGVYATAGLIYGVAALLLVARTSVGDPQAGQTDNLDSITAVVLGGTSLFGGRGSVIGTLIGALIVGIVRNGLQLLGVRSIYQVLITGVLVILAVAVDQLARRRQR